MDLGVGGVHADDVVSVHSVRFPGSWIPGGGRDDSDREPFHKGFELPVERLGRRIKAKFKTPHPKRSKVNPLRTQTRTVVPSLWIHSSRFESARARTCTGSSPIFPF